jgi:hypothetical protein
MALDPQVMLGRVNVTAATGSSATVTAGNGPGNAAAFPDSGSDLQVGDDLWAVVFTQYTPAQLYFTFPAGWTMTDRVTTVDRGRFELWHFGASVSDLAAFTLTVSSTKVGSLAQNWGLITFAFRSRLVDGPDTQTYPGVASGSTGPTEGAEIAGTAVLFGVNFGRRGTGGGVATANGWTSLGGSSGSGVQGGTLFLAKQTADGTTLPTFDRFSGDSSSVDYGWAIFAVDVRAGRRGLGLVR